MSPLARLLAAVGGRVMRSWWSRKSSQDKAAFWAALRRYRHFIVGVGTALALGGAVYYRSHLTPAPLTGRQRFMIVSPTELMELMLREKEEVLAVLCEGRELLPTSDPRYQHVQTLVSAILERNWSEAFEGLQWKLYIVDHPGQVNAVCLPSGELFVYTGLLAACRNSSELAFVLSHEVAHAVLGHGAEALSRRGAMESLTLLAVAVVWLLVPNDLAAYFLHRFTLSTAEVLLHLPYSRLLEVEADKVGLQFTARACFDPGEAVQVWSHLPSLDSGEQVVQLLSTHPSNASRLEQLSNLLPSAYSIWEESECETEMAEEVESFQKTVKKLLKTMTTLW